jgi:chromosome segregation ATPase
MATKTKTREISGIVTDTNVDRLLGALEATNKFIEASLEENKEEIRHIRDVIDSINKTLNELSNLNTRFQVYETGQANFQLKLDKQQGDITSLTDSIQDISERMESRKRLNWLIVGAFFTIGANIVVLIINIFFKSILKFFGL